MRSIPLLILGIIVTFILAACSPSAAIDPETIDDPDKGQELFENPTRGRCSQCHTLDGTDDPKAPSLQGISEQAGSRVPELSAVEYLEQSILEPSAFLAEGYQDRMKVFRIVVAKDEDYMFADMITEEEKNNLVAFMLTQ
jgi:mono/diheme cytochrome c family protein